MDYKKYIFAFVITFAIFTTALYFGNYFSNKKINAIKSTESKLFVDILASETQFALLSESSCKDISASTLSGELGQLGDKLNYLEEKSNTDKEEFLNLKIYYSVLEIKDFLLTKKIGVKCPNQPISILYFYSNECTECTKQGYALTSLHKKYPSLRVYSFDYNLDIPILRTLKNIYDISSDLPAIVINEKLYNGFKNTEELESLLPQRIKDSIKNTPASTTKTK